MCILHGGAEMGRPGIDAQLTVAAAGLCGGKIRAVYFPPPPCTS